MKKPILLLCWAAAAPLAACGTLDPVETAAASARMALEDPQAPPPDQPSEPAPSPPSPHPGGGGGCYAHTDVVETGAEGAATLRIKLRNPRLQAIPAPFALTVSNPAYTEAGEAGGWRVTDFNGGNVTGVVEDAGLEPGESRQFTLQIHASSDQVNPVYVAIDSNKCLSE